MAKVEIVAPLPGIFYTKPSPESEPFKSKDDKVNVGEILFLIEVMKTFNQIESEVDGVLVEYLVDNEEPVMVGQAVAVIETL